MKAEGGRAARLGHHLAGGVPAPSAWAGTAMASGFSQPFQALSLNLRSSFVGWNPEANFCSIWEEWGGQRLLSTSGFTIRERDELGGWQGLYSLPSSPCLLLSNNSGAGWAIQRNPLCQGPPCG